MTEEIDSPEVAAEEAPQKTIQDLLDDVGGPSAEQIEAWKTEFGEVFCSAFDEKHIYLWRYLRRFEYRELQAMLNNPDLKIDQFDYEEAVCKKCILWPAGAAANFALSKGGTATTIAEQIMQNSNFFNPAQAAALIMKL